MFRIGIVVITHNSAGHISACLQAVERFRSPHDAVLVIDNASDDGGTSLDAMSPPVRVIRNAHNAGFAGAANQGFEALKDQVDGILLLNPDVVLTTPLTGLAIACAREGLAGGRLNDSQGKAQAGFCFRRFPTPLTLFFETMGVNKLWKSNPVNRRYRCLTVEHGAAQWVDQPAGAMLMVRKDVWLRLNGFDEGFYPVWFEDVDFCLRAAHAGYGAAYVPDVEGIHEGGHSVLQLSNGNRRRYWYASLMRYSRKHFGRTGRGLVAGGVAVAAVVRALGMVFRLHEGSLQEAAMNLTIAQTALVSPKLGSAGAAADVRSRVLNEGSPSKENTERTLKRLHAR